MGNWMSHRSLPTEESIHETSANSETGLNVSESREVTKPFVDPRSISDDVTRTPIAKTDNADNAEEEALQAKLKVRERVLSQVTFDLTFFPSVSRPGPSLSLRHPAHPHPGRGHERREGRQGR